MPNPTLQDSIHEWQADEGITDATMIAGQLEVIAEHLAEANRHVETANLIAYQANVEASYVTRAPGKPRTDNAVDLNKQILERLGLS